MQLEWEGSPRTLGPPPVGSDSALHSPWNTGYEALVSDFLRFLWGDSFCFSFCFLRSFLDQLCLHVFIHSHVYLGYLEKTRGSTEWNWFREEGEDDWNWWLWEKGCGQRWDIYQEKIGEAVLWDGVTMQEEPRWVQLTLTLILDFSWQKNFIFLSLVYGVSCSITALEPCGSHHLCCFEDSAGLLQSAWAPICI